MKPAAGEFSLAYELETGGNSHPGPPKLKNVPIIAPLFFSPYTN